MKKNLINMKKGILIAFGELFLKSSNVQQFFKEKLVKILSFFLKKENIIFRLRVFRERIFIETNQIEKTQQIVRRVFGIAWLSKAIFFETQNLKIIAEFLKNNYQEWLKRNQTFALRIKKSPEIKKSSQEIIRFLAKNIKRKVDLEKPNKEIFCEIRREGCFLYFKKIKGKGGLPIGASGRVLALISGGIDSPVASYFLAKRGAENIWLHFHSFPLVSSASIEKTKELARIFLNYQPQLKIYFIPFAEIQMAVKTKIPPKFRILLYRRIMIRIAQKIAEKEGCFALVTGESLGQVSSQTLPNLKIIEEVTKLPILRPLISFDKEEIINFAKKIGTYLISIKPQEDCCTLFTPSHASAFGNLFEIKNLEKQLPLKILMKKAIKQAEILKL